MSAHCQRAERARLCEVAPAFSPCTAPHHPPTITSCQTPPKRETRRIPFAQHVAPPQRIDTHTTPTSAVQGARKAVNMPFGCYVPAFRHFTAQPFVLGVQDMLFKCGEHGHERKTFDFFHVEPASPCLFSEGRPVFDYVIRCALALVGSGRLVLSLCCVRGQVVRGRAGGAGRTSVADTLRLSAFVPAAALSTAGRVCRAHGAPCKWMYQYTGQPLTTFSISTLQRLNQPRLHMHGALPLSFTMPA